MTLTETGKRAKETAGVLGILGSDKKNEGLRAAAAALLEGEEDILTANQDDVIQATINGMSAGMIDRLELTPSRIEAMADGLISVAGLDDPVGEVISMKARPNGLTIGQKRVPMGVIGIIYEARPNVTADAFGLCFKSGNCVILKGGSDALESNKAIVKCLRAGLKNAGLPEDSVQLITDTDREVTKEFMRLHDYVDVLIPRGGAGLIRSVVENSREGAIAMDEATYRAYEELSDFMYQAVYLNEYAKREERKVPHIIQSLFLHFRNPDHLPDYMKKIAEEEGVDTASCDYVAGMTDHYAVACYQELFIPKAWNLGIGTGLR